MLASTQMGAIVVILGATTVCSLLLPAQEMKCPTRNSGLRKLCAVLGPIMEVIKRSAQAAKLFGFTQHQMLKMAQYALRWRSTRDHRALVDIQRKR